MPKKKKKKIALRAKTTTTTQKEDHGGVAKWVKIEDGLVSPIFHHEVGAPIDEGRRLQYQVEKSKKEVEGFLEKLREAT